MRSKHMVQSFHCPPNCRCRKQYRINRRDLVVCGTEVGRVVSIAVAWLKVPQVLVQFRDSQEWVPSEQVTKL